MTKGITDAAAQALARAGLDPRAQRVLVGIDWSAPKVLLWVPGTNEQTIPAGIGKALAGALPGVQMLRVPYEQSWHLRTSVPDGERVLGDVLRGVALLRAAGIGVHTELLMAGHSQGSWVMARSLARPVLQAQVARAVLFSNPGPNRLRYPGPGPLARHVPVGRVLEISNPRDLVAQRPPDIQAAIDAAGNRSRMAHWSGLVSTLLQDPIYAVAYIMRKWRLDNHPYGPGEDPHQYEREAAAAVRFLSDGHAALANIGRGPDWRDYRQA